MPETQETRAWRERMESKIELLVTAVIGGLDGKPGMLPRLTAVEADVAELKAAQRSAAAKWWQIALIPISGIAGALLSVAGAQLGGRHP